MTDSQEGCGTQQVMVAERRAADRVLGVPVCPDGDEG